MRAGRLRYRVTIQTPTETKGTKGQTLKSWATYKTRWMDVRPVTGSERYTGDQVTATVTHEFECRYVSGVTPKMRLSYDSRTFNISRAVNVDERDKRLLILATEEV